MSALSALLTSYAPSSVDPYYANSVLRLHCDSAGGFTDYSNAHRTVTVNGPTISTARSQFGGASGLFNGGTDRLAFSSISLAGNFTIDTWVYQTAGSGGPYTLLFIGSTGNSQFMLDYSAAGTVGAYINGGFIVSGAGAFSRNVWNHVAYVRNAGVITLYCNGNPVASGSSSVNVVVDTVGGLSSTGYSLIGNMDEVNIYDGVARWTSAFTPPTAPYANA